MPIDVILFYNVNIFYSSVVYLVVILLILVVLFVTLFYNPLIKLSSTINRDILVD